MSSLKVLHLSSEQSWRGGEQQIAYLIEYARDRGVDATVFCKSNSKFQEWCEANSIPFADAPFLNGMDVYTANAVRRYARKKRIDFVHVHSGKSHSIAYAAAKMGMKSPIIVHRRVDAPIKTMGPSLRKYKSDDVAAIICVSEAIAKIVRSATGLSDRVHVVHSGVDFKRFTDRPANGYLHREFGIDTPKKLIGNISALVDHKDYPTFIQTAKRLQAEKENIHFLIVGDGKIRHELQQLIDDHGLADFITMTGFRKDVPEILRELHIFLMTSKTEGLGTTVIDALHNSVPVVATRGGGIPELIRDGKDGFLSDVGDADSLASSIRRLLENESLYTEFSRNAKQRSLDFSAEKMGEGVLEIYRNVKTKKGETTATKPA